MASNNDPRVFFAAERTFLAWLRTGLGIVALGLAIAKYRIFIATLKQESITSIKQEPSFYFGVIIIVFGLLTILAALIQFYRFVHTLTPNEYPPRYSHKTTIFFGIVVQVMILFVLTYLILF